MSTRRKPFTRPQWKAIEHIIRPRVQWERREPVTDQKALSALELCGRIGPFVKSPVPKWLLDHMNWAINTCDACGFAKSASASPVVK